MVQLADDTLAPDERARALERIATAEGAVTAVERQRSARERVRAVADVPAPAGLRARVAALEADAQRQPRRSRRRWRWRWRQPAGRSVLAGVTAVAVAVAVAVVAITVGNPPTDKLVLRYAVAATRPIAAPPPPTASDPALLDRSFRGVTFPRWGPQFGWFQIGERQDVIEGRETHTVFYLHQGHRLAYTVVAGPPLPVPNGGRRVDTPAGRVHVYTPPSHAVDVPAQLLRHGGRARVAVFERGGHTCILAGVAHREDTLVMLASWKGHGAIAF